MLDQEGINRNLTMAMLIFPPGGAGYLEESPDAPIDPDAVAPIIEALANDVVIISVSPLGAVEIRGKEAARGILMAAAAVSQDLHRPSFLRHGPEYLTIGDRVVVLERQTDPGHSPERTITEMVAILDFTHGHIRRILKFVFAGTTRVLEPNPKSVGAYLEEAVAHYSDHARTGGHQIV